MSDTTENRCWETGKPLPEGMKDTAHFLTTEARTAWNNRRKNRGAEVLDLLWVWRFERGMARHLKVISKLCALLSRWHAEDKEAGRRSYGDPAEIVAKQTS